MSYTRKILQQKLTEVKQQAKVYEAKLKLYDYLKELDFYDKYIDLYLSYAEDDPKQVRASLKVYCTEAELKKVMTRAAAVYRETQKLHNLN